MKKLIRQASLAAGVLLLSMGVTSPAFAGKLAMFDASNGWTEFQDPHFNGLPEDGQVGPGVGGQKFDAEYLFYKWEGNTLNLVLQTGYDVINSEYTHSDGRTYYAGDLALSFDGDVTPGDGTTFEYGIDFGLVTKGYGSNANGPFIDFTDGSGIDPAGLYEVQTWSNDVYSGHGSSNPFAIDEIVANSKVDLTFQDAGFGFAGGKKSFYQHVAFDVTGLIQNGDIIDVHWTMSCGNDDINGGFVASVPEPESLAMMFLGLLALGMARVRKNRIAIA